jgi:glycosyltransferase involved in cell wall biosynthesis
MRVLMLNERDLSHPLAGGVEVHLEEIASRLVAHHGIEMTVLCAAFPGAVRDEVRNGIRYLRFGDRGFSYYAMLPRRAREELARGRHDLVVENLCKLLFFSQLYLPGPPRLALVHHLFGLSAFRQVSVPIASYVALTEALLPLVYRRWPFVVVSPSTRDDLIRRGLPSARIRVIPNGLDHERYRPDATRPAERDLVLFVGRLEHYKGVDVLLEAWPRVLAARPQARLVIVGAGSVEADMRRRVSSGAVGASVSFEGFVSEATKIDWLRRATVLVQPSHKEGWGLTVLEANACGTPVVATDAPGLRDSVRHGKTGLLVPRRDSASLGDAIVTILGDDRLRAELGRGALAWAGRFTWDEAAAAFAALLRAVAERRPLPELRDFLAPASDEAALVGDAGPGEAKP